MPQPLASQPLQDASAEARRSINAIVSATRAPFGGPATLSPDQIEELERALRQLEHQLAERTRFAEEMEVKYAERMRELAELETLLAAREKVIDAAKQRAAGRPESGAALSAEERAALDALKVELDRQESSLKEQREALAEREQFLEENEGKLFEKMQQQQERETEIEQKLEELQERLTATEQKARAETQAGNSLYDAAFNLDFKNPHNSDTGPGDVDHLLPEYEKLLAQIAAT
ncbi:MAG TPA: hypothetical protein PK879_11700, partial [Opitutaceae bacterium]|nr:hypothetical protein [Opitutaceae bacterium]